LYVFLACFLISFTKIHVSRLFSSISFILFISECADRTKLKRSLNVLRLLTWRSQFTNGQIPIWSRKNKK